MRRRFYLIHNPKAGINRRGLLRNVLSKLAAAGTAVTVATPDTREDDKASASAAAESGHYDAVIAAGGDSTIRGVASGLIGGTTPLGLIPLGAGNVLAREIAMNRRATAIANMLLRGKAITAHAAAVEGAPFLAMVGVGFDAQALGKLSQAMKRLSGRAAYAPAILRTLLSPIPEFNAVVDGVAYQANWIIVTNAANYGGGFLLSPESHISSPGLTAVLMRIPSRFALVQTLISLGLGTHLERENVSLIPCKTVRISAPSPQAIQIDGELCGATPAVVAQTDLEFPLITPEPRGE